MESKENYVKFEEIFSTFLRAYKDTFTAKDLTESFRYLGFDITPEELEQVLYESENVFPLKNGFFMTKPAAFSNCYFSFVLTPQEAENNLFVVADRFIPFLDTEIDPSSISFRYKGRNLKHKILEIDSSTARDLYMLFGDEYVSQYIASDEANPDMNLASNNFELPPKVKLTGFSLDKVFPGGRAFPGDRILCRIKNWFTGTMDIYPIPSDRKNPFKVGRDDIARQQWCEILENRLLQLFDEMGPGRSIAHQLSFAFFGMQDELCGKDCASIHEFLDQSKKIGIELFGVETRLWHKGEDVPAIGNWCKIPVDEEDAEDDFFEDLRYDVPDFIVDCYIKDMMFRKSSDLKELEKRIFIGFDDFPPAIKKLCSLQIVKRNDILRRTYNWFADYSISGIRKKTLELYEKTENMTMEIETLRGDFTLLPQQELITLTQISAHIGRMLRYFAENYEFSTEEQTAFSVSIEGMEYSFEDIALCLRAAIDKIRAEQFKVL